MHLTLTTLHAGEVLHRVHLDAYNSDQFNPGTHGNARFSPIKDEKGVSIPPHALRRHNHVLCVDGVGVS